MQKNIEGKQDLSHAWEPPFTQCVVLLAAQHLVHTVCDTVVADPAALKSLVCVFGDRPESLLRHF